MVIGLAQIRDPSQRSLLAIYESPSSGTWEEKLQLAAAALLLIAAVTFLIVPKACPQCGRRTPLWLLLQKVNTKE